MIHVYTLWRVSGFMPFLRALLFVLNSELSRLESPNCPAILTSTGGGRWDGFMAFSKTLDQSEYKLSQIEIELCLPIPFFTLLTLSVGYYLKIKKMTLHISLSIFFQTIFYWFKKFYLKETFKPSSITTHVGNE